jgi:hypothetical protein
MDIGKIVNREQLFDLELKHPGTDAPLGVTFMIRSMNSEEAKAVLREHTNANLKRTLKGKTVTAERLERQSLEEAAACIASWQWGGHTYHGSVPELDMKTAIRLLEVEDWIFQQVIAAARDIENFSQGSAKGSVAG